MLIHFNNTVPTFVNINKKLLLSLDRVTRECKKNLTLYFIEAGLLLPLSAEFRMGLVENKLIMCQTISSKVNDALAHTSWCVVTGTGYVS